MKESRVIDDTHLWELKELWDRRRQALGISEPATDLTAIDLEIRRTQWQQRGGVVSREIHRYVPFSSTRPRLAFTFLHPENWQVKVFEGNGHGEVFILGPRNDADTYSVAFAVHVFPAEEQGGKYAALDQVVADRLERNRGLPSFRVISRARGRLTGADASEFEVSYSASLQAPDQSARETPIVERRIILKRAGRFYEFIYRASEEDYHAYLEAFKDAVRTFEFRDEVARQEFYPMVMPEPVLVIREEADEYSAEEDE